MDSTVTLTRTITLDELFNIYFQLLFSLSRVVFEKLPNVLFIFQPLVERELALERNSLQLKVGSVAEQALIWLQTRID